MFAVAGGNAQTVQVLLSAGADVNHQAKDGLTALIDASAKGNSEIVRSLLDRAANSSAKISSDQWGELEKGVGGWRYSIISGQATRP